MPTQLFIDNILRNIQYWRDFVKGATSITSEAMDMENPNLLLGVQFGLQVKETWQNGIPLLIESFTVIDQHGYWRDWINQHDLAFKRDLDASNKSLLLNRQGYLYRMSGQLTRALPLHEQSFMIAQQTEEPLLIANAQLNLAETHRLQHNYELAKQLAQSALQTLTTLETEKTTPHQINLSNTLALIAWQKGDLAEAETWIRQAIQLQRSLNQPHALTRWINNLAIILQGQNKLHEAMQCYDEAKGLLQQTPSRWLQVAVLNSLGTLYSINHELGEAEAIFRQAKEIVEQQRGLFFYKALTHYNLASVLVNQNQITEAKWLLSESSELWKQLKDPYMLAMTYNVWGEALVLQDKIEEAKQLYDEAISTLQSHASHPRGQILLQALLETRQKL